MCDDGINTSSTLLYRCPCLKYKEAFGPYYYTLLYIFLLKYHITRNWRKTRQIRRRQYSKYLLNTKHRLTHLLWHAMLCSSLCAFKMNNNNNAAAAEDLSIHRAATFRGKRIINLLNNMYKWIGGGGGFWGRFWSPLSTVHLDNESPPVIMSCECVPLSSSASLPRSASSGM